MPTFIEMPKLSDTMAEGTVVKWRKAIGDTVEMGDVVAEVETDKAVMELEAFGEGTLSEVYVPEGGKARIGERLALLTAGDESKAPKPHEGPAAEQAPVSSAKAANPPAQPPSAQGTRPTAHPAAHTPVGASSTRVKASPLARKLAASQGLDLASVRGSGPGGRIVSRDLEPTAHAQPSPHEPAASAQPITPVAPAAPGAKDKRIPLSGMRKVIADRLLASKTQIPHFYLQIEIDAGPLIRLRAQVNEGLQKTGLGKLTINDFVLRSAVVAATRVPRANASFAGDAIIEYGSVHLAVAVAVEEGLMTPVIRDAQSKSLRELSHAVKDMAGRARGKRLKPEEYQGGTLTVSNLGSYGIETFSAIINPPQAVILSVGAIVKKPVINPEGRVVAGERMSIGLSADHRVVDGAVGAQYLAELRQWLENPTLLLV